MFCHIWVCFFLSFFYMLRKSKHLTIVQQKVRSGYNMIQLQYAYKCIWMFYMKMVYDEIEILRMEFGVHLY